MHNEKGFKKG